MTSGSSVTGINFIVRRFADRIFWRFLDTKVNVHLNLRPCRNRYDSARDSSADSMEKWTGVYASRRFILSAIGILISSLLLESRFQTSRSASAKTSSLLL